MALYYKVTISKEIVLSKEIVGSLLQAFYVQSLFFTQTYSFVFDGGMYIHIFTFINSLNPES